VDSQEDYLSLGGSKVIKPSFETQPSNLSLKLQSYWASLLRSFVMYMNLHQILFGGHGSTMICSILANIQYIEMID